MPSWRTLLAALRTMEARGEVRGGRFVAGMVGEQFALPEAVATLREARREAPSGELVAVSGVDPLNLVGTLLPGAKVPALAVNRVLYRDGVAVGALLGGETRWLEPLDLAQQRAAEDLLVRQRAGSPLLAYTR